MYSTFEVSKSGEDHFLLGPVLVPDVIDRQGDVVSAEEIAKACADYNQGAKLVFRDHERPLDGAEVIESYVTPGPMEVNGVRIPAGSWVCKCRVSREIHDAARRGAVKGFSVGGAAELER